MLKRLLSGAALSLCCHLAIAQETLRLDYFHTGNATQEIFSIDQLVIEPSPWPGDPAQPLDTHPRGKYLFEVIDSQTDKLLYSRSFSSIYGEWELTGEAKTTNRTFHESLRFPMPENKAKVLLKKRSYGQPFTTIWQTQVDPKDIYINRAQPTFNGLRIPLLTNGDPADKVDLLIIGDGYSTSERKKFTQDSQRLMETLFKTSPFKERKNDFNVWAVLPDSPTSGISRPSTGLHKDTPLSTTYDVFGSERYVLTMDNKAFRTLASQVPYEFVEILVNNETYGGGGIYGLYGTTASDSDWSDYVFVHEFGHHFAGLADEYYSSPVAYGEQQVLAEPYEPNVTAETKRNRIKWQQYINKKTPIPTPWEKESYDQHAKQYQAERKQIRANNRPESEMNKLFEENHKFEQKLFSKNLYDQSIGLFEGANYESKGYYRSAQNCMMFTRTDEFCTVCKHSITDIINLYSKQ